MSCSLLTPPVKGLSGCAPEMRPGLLVADSVGFNEAERGLQGRSRRIRSSGP